MGKLRPVTLLIGAVRIPEMNAGRGSMKGVLSL
jgi:hypothetical protein